MWIHTFMLSLSTFSVLLFVSHVTWNLHITQCVSHTNEDDVVFTFVPKWKHFLWFCCLLITSLEIGLCSISCIAGTVKQTWYKMNQASKYVFFISKWIQVHFWECTNSALIVLLGFFLWDKFSSSAVWVTCIISFGLGYMFSTSHVK